MSSPAVPPIPSPWPSGQATLPKPGVADFLCQMVRELRSLRAESGLPRGMTWSERIVNLSGNNPQELVPYNSRRRLLWITSNSGSTTLTTVPGSVSPNGIWTMAATVPFILTWQQYGELCQLAIFVTNGIAGVPMNILEGIAPN